MNIRTGAMGCLAVLAGAFKASSGGMLEAGDGDSFSLGGSGIQEKVTEQVCDLVLEHAQSLL